MKQLILSIIFFFLLGTETFAQSGSWALKANAYSSRQRLTNLVSSAFLMSDTLIKGPYVGSGHGGGFGRATFGLMLMRDYAMTSQVALQVGAGYRQKGFRTNARYLQDKGYTVPLPARTVNDNLFHYLTSEISLQFRTKPKPTVGYLRLGNRLDYLLGFRSEFWGDNYAYLSNIDYNVFFSAGVERSLKKRIFPKKTDASQLYSRPSALFLEIEITPPVFNIHKTPVETEPFVRVTDKDGTPLLPFTFRMQKVVRNTGFGVVVGLRF